MYIKLSNNKINENQSKTKVNFWRNIKPRVNSSSAVSQKGDLEVA